MWVLFHVHQSYAMISHINSIHISSNLLFSSLHFSSPHEFLWTHKSFLHFAKCLGISNLKWWCSAQAQWFIDRWMHMLLYLCSFKSKIEVHADLKTKYITLSSFWRLDLKVDRSFSVFFVNFGFTNKCWCVLSLYNILGTFRSSIKQITGELLGWDSNPWPL